MAGFYSYSLWQKLRKVILRNSPLCVYCQKKGILTPAEVVDHIKPHRGDRELFFDANNLQSLCKKCHDSDKQKEEYATRPIKMRIGEDGFPLNNKNKNK